MTFHPKDIGLWGTATDEAVFEALATASGGARWRSAAAMTVITTAQSSLKAGAGWQNPFLSSEYSAYTYSQPTGYKGITYSSATGLFTLAEAGWYFILAQHQSASSGGTTTYTGWSDILRTGVSVHLIPMRVNANVIPTGHVNFWAGPCIAGETIATQTQAPVGSNVYSQLGTTIFISRLWGT